MGTANAIKRELDDVGELLTGEDAVEFLMESVGWDKAKQFSLRHNALVAGHILSNDIKYQIGKVSGNPLYSREDLVAWANL